MKTLPYLQSLTQQLNKWRRRNQPLRRFFPAKPSAASADSKMSADTILKQEGELKSTALKQASPSRVGRRSPHRFKENRYPAILIVALVSITSVMGQRFYNQPKLDVNTIAPQTIQAPANARVEDTKSTEAGRKAARTGAVPVLMVDASVNENIALNLQEALDRGNELRQVAGNFPFAPTSVLSASTQLYLRECPELEWQAVFNAARNSNNPKKPALDSVVNTAVLRAVAELEAYQLVSPQKLSSLIATISQARQRYAQALAKFSAPAGSTSETQYDTSLLALSDNDWEKTQTGIRNIESRIITQGIPPGLPQSIIQEAVRLQVQTLIPAEAENLASNLLVNVLKPNLKQDVEQTRLQAEQAASAVAPVIVEVYKGEVIVQVGEVITQQDFVLLDYFNLSRREINWLGLIQIGGLVIAAVGVFELVERQFHARLRQRDRLLVLLFTLSTPLLVLVGVNYTSLPAVGLLMGSFYGSALGVTVVGLVAVLLPGSLPITWEHLLASAVGGLLGSWMAGRLRSREELALLGGAVGLTQLIVHLLVNLILGGTFASSLWYVGVGEAALSGLAGLAWSIVALGLSPYLEHLFDLVTPSRLAELANPNRPLLKRLATEAPGTFQHTLFVATLAEAAAKALECNVELVRAGTMYHDIGKLHDPLAFIENQMGRPNKHDEIEDPWQSAEIIKKHVSEGLVMARKHRLPAAIQAFIPEHQGTMLIAVFYHKAQQLAQQNAPSDGNTIVNEADFRYDGPIPQSRETGLVMLADGCEAALRSLKDACPEEALIMVNKILRARWQDNQMADSGLTREEMSQIAELFVEVWQQLNHKRIAYPKMAVRS